MDLIHGGLKLVKIAPSSSHPPHQHNDKTEYIYILEGSLNIVIGNNRFTGKKGDFYLLPQSVKHSIENTLKVDSIILLGNIAE